MNMLSSYAESRLRCKADVRSHGCEDVPLVGNAGKSGSQTHRDSDS